MHVVHSPPTLCFTHAQLQPVCMCPSILTKSATHVYLGTLVSSMDVRYRKKLHGVHKMHLAKLQQFTPAPIP